jgi:hypothetical protein
LTELKTTDETKSKAAVQQFVDSFSDTPAGSILGSTTSNGVIRKGVDKERVLAIDNGALRIKQLIRPGWGRSGISYGPYTRQNGLAFGTFILNGHNSSQRGYRMEPMRSRIRRWALGTETEKPLERMRRLLKGRQKRHLPRTFLHWLIAGSRLSQHPALDENLAVGWFDSDRPFDPLQRGNSIVVHSLGAECGELWSRAGDSVLKSVRGVQNIPMYYLVVLRERGAAYYAASLLKAPGFNKFPTLRLLGIDPFDTQKEVHAGVHQSVLGQIGWRAETRVYRNQVTLVPEYSQWYGSAHGADQLTGEGSLHISPAETGGQWNVREGDFRRTAEGLITQSLGSEAVLPLPSPAGLVHVLVETNAEKVDNVALLWRVQDDKNFWGFHVSSKGCWLNCTFNGISTDFPLVTDNTLLPNGINSVQVSDDGESIRLYLNGEMLYGGALVDTRLNHALATGVRVSAKGVRLRDFEAHPREIPVPANLSFQPFGFQDGTRTVFEDDFSGPAGTELAGRSTVSGGGVWKKEIGIGAVKLTGTTAAKVQGSIAQPSPGRLAYTLPWKNSAFADVAVRLTAPGTRRGSREKGRGGLIFWQDERNYLTLSFFVDDWYGTSVAGFFYVDGLEDLYDAVWTNLGKRIYWGVPYDYRVVFDGEKFMCYINEEPVFYRALSDIYPSWRKLEINQIGLVTSWEFGNDTGTIFQDFVAKDRA